MISRINKLGRKSRAIVYAIGVHLLIVIVLGISFNWKIPTAAAPAGEVTPVQATIVPESALNEEIAKIEQRDLEKKQQEEEEKQRLEDIIKEAAEKEEERKQEEEKLAKIKNDQEEEKAKAEQLAQERKKEEERLSKLKLEEDQRKKEEEIAKIKAEEERKEEEKLIAERKKQEEEDRKKKEAAEKKEKERLAEIEAEKKRKEDEARKLAEAKAREDTRKKAEQELQTSLEAERVRGEAKSALVSNIGAIQRKVSRNWLQPQSFKPGQTAKIQVKVSPTGDIIDAKIVSGSGDPIFDRSVFNAVMKSSPLPIPQDSRYYPHIQTFNFLFSPYG